MASLPILLPYKKIWYHSVNGSGALSQVAIGEGLLELYKKNDKDLRFKFWFSNVDNKGEFFYDENTYCYIQTTPNYNIGVPEMMLIKAEHWLVKMILPHWTY